MIRYLVDAHNTFLRLRVDGVYQLADEQPVIVCHTRVLFHLLCHKVPVVFVHLVVLTLERTQVLLVVRLFAFVVTPRGGHTDDDNEQHHYREGDGGPEDNSLLVLRLLLFLL